MSYIRDDTPRPGAGLRLLPWESDTGKPCYLSTDRSDGMLSQLADRAEEARLSEGDEILKCALAALSDHRVSKQSLRLILTATATALADVLRIADSRGARLTEHDDGEIEYFSRAHPSDKEPAVSHPAKEAYRESDRRSCSRLRPL
ncbi:hypothetical protein LHJ74_04450 [Streptomyces sp. N2-109]|uniref:Uncharacterized protein n=1 Tax=Streptomyces gossypii TaxID=2883101 RepID=A0ABT2JMT8_9ACTN|nr:hypothetical protein [Streptomyces gossypii]MCT2589190.1 hypothetical protein [Streptomyces gossypii]